jgi:low temperature requirement protein LtrA
VGELRVAHELGERRRGDRMGVMLVATIALFLAALAVPEAFAAHRVVFGVAFFFVVVAFVGLYTVVSRGRPDQLAAVLRMSRTVLLGATGFERGG